MQDIDQFFSRLCSDLMWNDVPCRSALGKCIRGAYSPAPTVVQLGGEEAVANWSWFMNKYKFIKPNFAGTTKCRAFCIVLTDDKQAEIFTKTDGSDPTWVGVNGTTDGFRSESLPFHQRAPHTGEDTRLSYHPCGG